MSIAATHSNKPSSRMIDQTIRDYADAAASTTLSYAVIYILICAAIFCVIMAFIFVSIFDPATTTRNVMTWNVLFIAIEAALLIFTLRNNKYELLKALGAVKEAKKVFVRYISHELRTPLNTAFLGTFPTLLVFLLLFLVFPFPSLFPPSVSSLSLFSSSFLFLLYIVKKPHPLLTTPLPSPTPIPHSLPLPPHRPETPRE